MCYGDGKYKHFQIINSRQINYYYFFKKDKKLNSKKGTRNQQAKFFDAVALSLSLSLVTRTRLGVLRPLRQAGPTCRRPGADLGDVLTGPFGSREITGGWMRCGTRWDGSPWPGESEVETWAGGDGARPGRAGPGRCWAGPQMLLRDYESATWRHFICNLFVNYITFLLLLIIILLNLLNMLIFICNFMRVMK